MSNPPTKQGGVVRRRERAFRRPQAGCRCIVAAALAGVIITLAIAPSWLTSGPSAGSASSWLRQAVFGTTGLRLLSCFLAAGSLLWLTVSAMAHLARGAGRAGLRPWSIAGCTRGTAIIEFALLFPVAMTLFLLTLQTAFMYVGNFYVNLAAFRAARVAIVWASTEPELADARYTRVIGPETQARALQAAVQTCAPIAGTSVGMGERSAQAEGLAEAMVLMSGSPTLAKCFPRLARQFDYACGHTRVRLLAMPRPEPSVSAWNAEHQFFYRRREPITVEVTHDFELVVPLARWLIGRPWDQNATDRARAGGGYSGADDAGDAKTKYLAPG